MNGIVAIIAIIGAVFTLVFASYVGKERAKAMAECYKAAQVNTNIRCDLTQAKD